MSFSYSCVSFKNYMNWKCNNMVSLHQSNTCLSLPAVQEGLQLTRKQALDSWFLAVNQSISNSVGILGGETKTFEKRNWAYIFSN